MHKALILVLACSFYISSCQIFNDTSFGILIPHFGPAKPTPAPKYTLQLNDDPKDRWKPIVKEIKNEIHKFLKIVNLLPIPKKFWEEVTSFAESYPYQEYIEEIRGIAEEIDAKFEELLVLNFSYEFSTFKACSGIIVRNEDGQILHGRNLDFYFMNYFSKLSAQVDFYKGDEYIATIDSILGTVFALTGTKLGKFTMNEDTRKSHNFTDVLHNLIHNQYMPTTFKIRETLLEATDWSDAVSRMKNANVTAPAYLIISGVSGNEGIVIEKDPVGFKNAYYLNDDDWYLVQTNYDRDQKDPWHDNRRTHAEKRLNKLGQNITAEILYEDVMIKWPTFNIGTVHTLITNQAIEYQNLTTWYGTDPINIWNWIKDKVQMLPNIIVDLF